MAKTIELMQADTTTGISVTLTAGGNLAASTTYYYRFIGWRMCYQGANVNNYTHAFSEPSAEFTITTDTTNKSADIAWTPGANVDGVIIQRTTTSGSYPATGTNTFRAKHASAVYPIAVDKSITSFSDDGSYNWNAPNLDHEAERPVIHAYSDANDVIKPQDIYLADVAGSWGLVDKIFVPSGKSLTTAAITNQIPYVILGGLLLSDCIFELNQMLIILQGTVVNTANTVTYRYGTNITAGTNYPYYFYLTPFFINYITDLNATGSLYRPCMLRDLFGASGSYAYKMIRRPLNHTTRVQPYDRDLWDDGTLLTNGTGIVNECVLGLGAANGLPLRAATYTDNTFEGFRHNFRDSMSNSIVKYANEGVAFRWDHNGTQINPRIQHSYCDSSWGNLSAAVFINPTFESRGQTNNQPYFRCQCSSTTYLGHTLCIYNSLGLTVMGKDGNPISGATATIKDQNGYSDIWTATTSLLMIEITATSGTNVRVSDTSVFSPGDIIKHPNTAERMEVVSITDALNMVVKRGQQETVARRVASGSTTQYITKQVASLTTNASGQITMEMPLLHRELAIARSDGSYYQEGYENDLITAGYLTRNQQTHTITVTATGYQTKTMVLDMDRKREEVVVLEKQVETIVAKGKVAINTEPENSQSDVFV
jgi:hypothetical protein